MARIEGPIVAALQGVFAENWLECGGEILTSPRALASARAGRDDGSDAGEELAGRPRDDVARQFAQRLSRDQSGRSISRQQYATEPGQPGQNHKHQIAGHSRVVWITDLLPNELAPTVDGLMEQGCAAIKRTLESAVARV